MSKAKESTPKTEEFARFQDLTRKLVAVPKGEVNKEQAKYDKAKEKRPAK